MTLAELEADVRGYLDDSVPSYLFTRQRIRYWLNEAIQEAAIRGRLLRTDSDADLCRLSLSEGTAIYSFDPAVMVIQSAWLVDEEWPILQIMRDYELDRRLPRWRTESSKPQAIAPDLNTKQITVAPVPDDSYTLGLAIWRVPTEDEKLSNDTDEPVIAAHYHGDLHHWVLYRAKMSRDLETYRPEEARMHLIDFEAKFGVRPSAEHLERWQFERPTRVKAHWM